jgi:uncharacterized membrane protein
MRPQIEILRLVTIHPALVHFALGGLPIILLSYLLARWQRSERWSFVGDVATVVTAAAATASLASGLLSNALVPWPGGLETWRAIHLSGGVASAVALVTLAVARLAVRRRSPGSGNAAVAGALVAAALVGFTGWVGGDVLVFHSGMAVKAAAYGATAPPTSTRRRLPRDLLDAMRQIRASWAATNVLVSAMIVEEPEDRDFDVLTDQSRRIEELASWVARAAPSGAQDGSQDGSKKGSSHLSQMAKDLEVRARGLEASGRQHDLAAAATSVGAMEAVCAGCHDTER